MSIHSFSRTHVLFRFKPNVFCLTYISKQKQKQNQDQVLIIGFYLFWNFSDFLVKVRAQVMTRDESTEGWLPLAGGGLANVSIRKRARLPPDVGGHEYIIYGQRISDQTVSWTNEKKHHMENS